MNYRLAVALTLFVILAGAFWCVDQIAERLIHNNTNEKGRDFVDSIWMKFHWEQWETDPERKKLLSELIRDLLAQPYSYRIIALGDDPHPPPPPKNANATNGIFPPADDWESAEIPKLREKWLAHLKELNEQSGGESRFPKYVPDVLVDELAPTQLSRRVPASESGKDKNEYAYYQPVYWKESCARCHQELGNGATPSEAPFRVVKVTMPCRATQGWINWTRSILSTIFVATYALTLATLWLLEFLRPAANSSEILPDPNPQVPNS